MFWFFGREACGILAPQPAIEPTPPALEGEVLTTGLPGKSLFLLSERFPQPCPGLDWVRVRLKPGVQNLSRHQKAQ